MFETLCVVKKTCKDAIKFIKWGAMEKNKRAIVIGAGVSGLVAAVELKRLGFEVIVLERENRAGGVIGTYSKDGFKAETGTNTIMIQSQRTLDFVRSLGLDDKIEFPSPASKKRFFARYGKIRAVPMSPLQLLTTRLYTFFGKLRFFYEPFVKPDTPDSEPSVADFTTRRLGREALDYGMNPFMAGVYGGDPKKLSVKYALPQFWNLVQKYGSLFKGGAKSRADKMAAGNYFKPIMVSFEGGMQTLTDRLAETLGDSLKTSVKVLSVDADSEGGWSICWGDENDETCESADVLVLAVPAPEIKHLPLCGTLSTALAPLDNIQYAPVATYTMGFARADVAHKLDGFGVLLPEKEPFSILGSLFLSSLFKGRAADDCITLTNYVGGMRNPELARASQGKMREVVLRDLRKLLGVKAEPVFEKMTFWEHAIPQYNLGYGEFLKVIDDAEKQYTNLGVIGSFRGGVGVSSCVESAMDVAVRLSSEG